MKIKVDAKKPKDGELKAKVTIPAEEVDAAVAQAYKDVASRYNFQGFRRGRAPRPVIDGIVGKDAVRAQATNDILNAAEPLMLEELDIVPIGQVSYGDNPDLVCEGKDYSVDATIGVRPEPKLSSYDAPTINMPPDEATDAEIDAQIQQLLSYQTTYEDVKEKRAAKSGDFVSVDIDNIESGENFAGKNRMLSLDGVGAPAALLDAIAGMKAGQEKEVSWTEEHEHDGETHSHEIKLKVTLNAIRKAVTPELDAKTAKKNFGFDTVEEVRTAIKEEIENDKKLSLPSLKEDRVVEAMGEKLELDEVPEAYRNQIFNELVNDFLSQLQRQGITLDMFLAARGIETQDFLNDLQAQSVDRARQSLALDALAAKQGFEAAEEEILAEFERAGAEDAKAMMEEWRSEGRLPAIRESIKRTKALKWLSENAKVKIVDEMAEAAKEAKSDKKSTKKSTAKKSSSTKSTSKKKSSAKSSAKSTSKSTKKTASKKKEEKSE